MTSPDAERELLRETFDRASDLYQRVRPDYPAELFDRLLEVTVLRPEARLKRNGVAPGIVMSERGGRHGQELLDEGHARLVLRLVGSTLRKLQTLETDTVVAVPGEGTVLVHGDFGPQNMLFDLVECLEGGGTVDLDIVIQASAQNLPLELQYLQRAGVPTKEQ